jgi:glucose/arabinose dehydrogenase
MSKIKITTFSIAVFLILILTITNCGIAKKGIYNKKTLETYSKLCSDCHGKNITDFEKIKWNHGITELEIYNSIAYGYDDLGMPAYHKTLSKKSIKSLAEAFVIALENKNDIKLEPKPTSNTYSNQSITIQLDTIASGLDKPWGIATLENNVFLITDRNGTLYKVQNKVKTVIKNVPKVLSEGQGGLLDIVLHPQYKQNGWLYCSYSKPALMDSVAKSTTAIFRAKLLNDSLTNIEHIFEALPYLTTKHHYGCRMVFDNNGYLFFGVGERGKHFEYPQKLDNDLGKIHRLHDDGTIPTSNPFYNTKGAHPSIYAYGIRNPQGIALHPITGQIWETEHGPKGGDEINIINAGVNYGWPVISYGINYNGSSLTKLRQKDSMEQPIHYWVPSIAPSGLSFVHNSKYKNWEGGVLVNSLKFKYLELLKMEGNKVIATEKLMKNIGRMRQVIMGSDGYIYISIEDPGTVFRLRPL